MNTDNVLYSICIPIMLVYNTCQYPLSAHRGGPCGRARPQRRAALRYYYVFTYYITMIVTFIITFIISSSTTIIISIHIYIYI